MLICALLYVPIRNVRWRMTGLTPMRASHTMVGNGAIVRLDLGMEPAVTDVICEVHIPHYQYVGGQPKGTARYPKGSVLDRQAAFRFPDSFGLAPVFQQLRCVGWYHVRWVVTQYGNQRTVSDKFHIRRYSMFATIRQAWKERGESDYSFWVWTAAVLSMYFLNLSRLSRVSLVQRGWNRMFRREESGAPSGTDG